MLIHTTTFGIKVTIMIAKPNVKINLGLNVIRKREDGFHDLETLFVPYFGISDTLEIISGDDYSFSLVAPAGTSALIYLSVYPLKKEESPESSFSSMRTAASFPMFLFTYPSLRQSWSSISFPVL